MPKIKLSYLTTEKKTLHASKFSESDLTKSKAADRGVLIMQ